VPLAIDTDVGMLFYTSGSTGKPKGVVLSHRNLVAGARSVSSYLGNTPDDRLLAVLSFSFDYGFSQLSTAFAVGASVVLLDYLTPQEVLLTLARERVTGLAAVPPIWIQLADQCWPKEVRRTLRYITNSGGVMPRATLARLRQGLPQTRIYLMYGLTEAFRSTYLPPEEVDRRPDSIGKAIPGAEVLVVRPDGTPCAVGEPGELVHCGSLVALGYWNDPARTAERFRPAPTVAQGRPQAELAVWSGDIVRRDAEGYLYFIGRRDEMIKTSGYRVSPTEVEEEAYACGCVCDAVAVGVPHARLGHGIVLVASPPPGAVPDTHALLTALRRRLPRYMVPLMVDWRETLPRNANGKFDRERLRQELAERFVDAGLDDSGGATTVDSGAD
jgi:acyl-CoA ligase (AMP-forming) (exosortase A-associated)